MSYLTIISAIIGVIKGIFEIGPIILNTIRNNKSRTTIIVLLIMLVGMAYVGATTAVKNAEVINTHFPSPETEHKAFIAAQRVVGQINTRLEMTQKRLNASRVIIFQYHNGQTDLSGLPFTKVSATYGFTKRGVESNLNDLQNTPISMWYDIHRFMWSNVYEPKCTKIDYNDVINDTLHDRMKKFGAEVIYSCPLVNMTGGPVGQVNVAYMDRLTIRPSDDLIFAEIEDVAKVSSGYLIAARESIVRKTWLEDLIT